MLRFQSGTEICTDTACWADTTCLLSVDESEFYFTHAREAP